MASEDDGTYTCIAANDVGSVSSSASLRVLGECQGIPERSAPASCLPRVVGLLRQRDP